MQDINILVYTSIISQQISVVKLFLYKISGLFLCYLSGVGWFLSCVINLISAEIRIKSKIHKNAPVILAYISG